MDPQNEQPAETPPTSKKGAEAQQQDSVRALPPFQQPQKQLDI